MPRVPPVTSATRAMSIPSLDVSRLCFLFSFELCGPFDQHQEQNARQCRAFLISENFCGCEMIFSSRRAARLIACNAHRNAHAAADAQRGEALLGVAGVRGEGLIGLDQVEVADAPAGLLQRRA